jgi:hypothetical protein
MAVREDTNVRGIPLMGSECPRNFPLDKLTHPQMAVREDTDVRGIPLMGSECSSMESP